MRARRRHGEARAGRDPTTTDTHHCQGNCTGAWVAALCKTSSVRGVAGRGAGVCARARAHGATARHVPSVACCRRRHRRRTQDGVCGVPTATSREALELFRRRRWNPLRTCHAHRNERSGVHVRDHVGWRHSCPECSLCARRSACLPVYHQPSPRHVNVGSVRVGRVRNGRVWRATGAALPGRARARARRARAHEPAQQPRGPQDSEGPGPSRVQVPRRVGLLRCAHMLACAAALPRRGHRAARPLRTCQACGTQLAASRAGGARTGASRACEETEAERRRGASATQVRPGVPSSVAVVLRARRRHRLARHAHQDMQQDLQRRRWLRVSLLRTWLQHSAQRGGDQVPLPLPLVLPRVMRHLRRAHRDTHLQLNLDKLIFYRR